KILEWRQVSKLKSTYTDALPTYVNPQTHRVHTTYALAATTTGRLSSNEPNLQNIPVRTADGRKIRRAFIATSGHKPVSADIAQYFERSPCIRAYMDETRDFCRSHGYVTTLFGRKMYYPDIKASHASVRAFNERAAINARLQATAADIIRRAMTRMEDALAEKKLSAQMLLQVHDELIFEVPDAEVEATLPVVQHVMQDAPFPAVLLSVPLHVDARAANNWDEAH